MKYLLYLLLILPLSVQAQNEKLSEIISKTSIGYDQIDREYTLNSTALVAIDTVELEAGKHYVGAFYIHVAKTHKDADLMFQASYPTDYQGWVSIDNIEGAESKLLPIDLNTKINLPTNTSVNNSDLVLVHFNIKSSSGGLFVLSVRNAATTREQKIGAQSYVKYQRFTD